MYEAAVTRLPRCHNSTVPGRRHEVARCRHGPCHVSRAARNALTAPGQGVADRATAAHGAAPLADDSDRCMRPLHETGAQERSATLPHRGGWPRQDAPAHLPEPVQTLKGKSRAVTRVRQRGNAAVALKTDQLHARATRMHKPTLVRGDVGCEAPHSAARQRADHAAGAGVDAAPDYSNLPAPG